MNLFSELANIPTQGWFVIASLLLMQGLLSMDNVIVILTKIKQAPENERAKAMTLTIAGAIVVRILALLALPVIESNPILLVFGGLYLVYMMSEYLVGKYMGTHDHNEVSSSLSLREVVTGLFLCNIWFSIDNVASAVAMTHNHLWISIGILGSVVIMALLIKLARPMLTKFPVLEPAGYALVGSVGLLLLIETLIKLEHWPEIPDFVSIIMVFTILVGAIAVDRNKKLAERLQTPGKHALNIMFHFLMVARMFERARAVHEMPHGELKEQLYTWSGKE